MRENNVSCSPVQNLGWGSMTDIELPGGATLGIYQPTYPAP